MISILISIIQTILLAGIGFFMTYLFYLSLLAYKERDKEFSTPATQRRFAIVVPAYNEESSLPGTLENLKQVNYPDDRFDIIVIADNCTDDTANIAEEHGTEVMVRNNPEKRGKGYALRWCFDQLIANNESNQYDAAVVVDADSIVSKNLLEVMNSYMEDGAKVVQGYLTVASKPGVWTSEIIRIGFTLYNYVRPMGRRAIECPAGLRGNGMCFSMDVLKQNPWDAYSLTEDLEYGIKLLLNDVNVVFAPEAIGYNVVPEDADDAESQRERWEIGRFPILKKYFGKLAKNAFKKRSFKIFDTLVDLVTPPLVNMMIAAFGMAAASLFLWSIGVSSLFWLWLWIGVIGMGMLHALIGLVAAGVGWKTYRSLLYVPKYAVWKLYIYGKVLLFDGPTTEWVRTSRNSD